MLFTVSIDTQMSTLKMSEEKENRRHLDDLEKYSEQVESLYETLRSFRHDYTNVMISLNEAIQMKDIDQIKMIYDSVLKDSASDLNQQSLI